MKILITSAGTGGGYSCSKFIKDFFKDKVKLFQIDINPKILVSSSIYSDYFYQSPRVDALDYEDFIIKLINDNKIDIVIPFIDNDVFILSKLFSENKINNKIKLQIKNPNYANICLNKYLAYKWMVENQINTPFTFLLNERVVDKKYLIKPIAGFGSSTRILSLNSIKKIDKKSSFIGQDICDKPEITVDVFYNEEKNDFYYLCRERLETKEGVCTKARLFNDNEIELLALKMAKELQLSYFCFQIMKLNDNWAVTDINPRLGAGSAMSSEVGMDFYGAMVSDLLNENYQKHISQFIGEAYVTRQYINIRTDE